MAESNTARLGLRRWTAGTDTPQRVEFDTGNANLETLAAIDKQDTFANRPAAGVRGTYFWDTTNEYLWRDNGSAWAVLGSKTLDQTIKSSAIGVVPLTIDAITGQTASLIDAKVNGSSKFTVSTDGDVSGRNYSGRKAVFDNTGGTAADVVIAGKGAAAQSGELLRLRNTSDVNMFTVSAAGVLTSPLFATAVGGSSVINASTGSNVANMAYWAGTPRFEMVANTAAAFNDFIYLKHAAAAASAATRRLGFVMKAGDEDVAGAGRSAAVYLQSDAASFDTPSLKVDVRDQVVWAMDPTDGSVTPFRIATSNSYVEATPASTGFFKSVNTWLGTQGSGNHMYFRAGSTSSAFYWYGGGSHNAAAANAGGGNTYMSLVPEGSVARATIGHMTISDVVEADVGTSNPMFMLGAPSGENMIFDTSEIMVRNNGVADSMSIQNKGGFLFLGNDDAAATYTKVFVNNFQLHIGFDPPPVKQSGTTWIRIDAVADGGGVYRWNSGSNVWVKVT